MRIVYSIVALFLGFNAFSQSENFSIPVPNGETTPASANYTKIDRATVVPGEELFFKLTFGWFTIGKANMKVDKKSYYFNGRSAYKVDIYGRTSGMVDWIAQVDDRWGSYIDQESFVSHKAYRYIKEGNYRKNEITKFDHRTDMIEVTVQDKKTGEYRFPKYYKAKNNVYDMIGRYSYQQYGKLC